MTDFKDQLNKLAILSQADEAVNLMNQKLNEIPEARNEIQAEWKQFQRQLEEKQGIRNSLEAEKKEKDLELKTAEDDVKKKEARLYEIKTNKEYQASVKEISDTKNLAKEIEEKVLVLMEQIEITNKETSEIEEASTKRETETKGRLDELEEEEKTLQVDLQAKILAREAVLKEIDSKILPEYKRIKQARENAIVILDGRNCAGCSMSLPAQLYNQVLRKDGFYSCPNCSRILCLKENQAGKLEPTGSRL